MPLPFIIGGLGLAAAAVATAVLLDDDTPSSSNEHEREKIREETIKKEQARLKAQEKKERKQRIKNRMFEKIEFTESNLKNLIKDYVDFEIVNDKKTKDLRSLKKQFNHSNEEKENMVRYFQPYSDISNLAENILHFQSVYNVSVRPKSYINQDFKEMNDAKKEVHQSDSLIQHLKSTYNV